jgi:hypothetical protein
VSVKESFCARYPGEEADFVVLDLLEERFDLLNCDREGIFTRSDALEESLVAFPCAFPAHALERGTEDAETLWRKACLVLISELRKKFQPDHIILLKTFLAEAYGEYGPEQAFDGVTGIRVANAHLRCCYAFFEEHCPGVHIVAIPERLSFCDASFKHGRMPWHLNDFCY